MNLAFRVIVTENEAKQTIDIDNMKSKWIINKHPVLEKEIEEIDFYNTIGYLENLTMKEEICWRKWRK
jgi:hypothetical protein